MTRDVRDRFRALHADGRFVMPNPWDIGSARMLASLGFPALATTSSGHAASLGRRDQHVVRDERAAYGELVRAATELRDQGTSSYIQRALSGPTLEDMIS